MKVYFLVVFISSISILNAQKSINVYIVPHNNGLYYEIAYQQNISGRHQIGLGLKINDGLIPSIPKQSIYSLYPNSFLEFLGIKLKYEYELAKKEDIEYFVFFISEYTKCTARSYAFFKLSPDSLISPHILFEYYSAVTDYAGPYNWFDERAGVGLNCKLSGSFFFSFFAGTGITFLSGRDTYKDHVIIAGLSSPSLNYCLGAGIRYYFGNK